jgi:hypothetical protein
MDELLALVVEVSGHIEALAAEPLSLLMHRCPGVFTAAIRLAREAMLE